MFETTTPNLENEFNRTVVVRITGTQERKIEQVAKILRCNKSRALRAMINAVTVGGMPDSYTPTLQDLEREEFGEEQNA